MNEPDYKEINRKSWNRKTEVHITSVFYNNEEFIKGKSSLNPVELELLGDIRGKKVLHLQCHFGQDTISMARLGADVTGVDLSDQAILRAKELAVKTSQAAHFVNCDIYDLPNHLDEKFDIVFTSYGTIGWLPDLNRWGEIVNRYLKPKGKFLIVEFHPFVWMYDDSFDHIKYPYSSNEPIHESEVGTYANADHQENFDYVMWNHGLSHVVNSLIKNGLTINLMDEYDYSPYDIFEGSIERAPNQFVIEKFGSKVPLVYSIVATKP
ncbi:MAG: SAM-dependent methyltransferase [Patiriisocius sp.]|jgi:SAM-dependent methyltransferase